MTETDSHSVPEAAEQIHPGRFQWFFHIRRLYLSDSAFTLLIAILFLVPLVFIFPSRENFETPKLALWAAGTGLVLLLVAFSRRRHRPSPWIVWGGIAWVVWYGLATLFSTDRANSLIGLYPRFTGSFLFALLCAGSLLTLVTLVYDRQRQRLMVEVLIAAGACISALGILQSYGIGYYDGVGTASIYRAPSLLGNPNFSSMFVAAVLPFAVLCFRNARSRKVRWYYGIVTVLFLVALTLFSSRGALLGAGAGLVGMGAIALLYRKQLRKQLVAIGVAVALLGVLTFMFLRIVRPVSSSGSAATVTDTNSVTRVVAWEAAVTAIRSHPWLGVGPGNFALFYERTIRTNVDPAFDIFDDAHNLPLTIAATAGLPALLLLFACIVYAMYRGMRKFSVEGDWLLLSAFGGLVALLTAACFNPVTVPLWQLLIVLLALLIVGSPSASITDFDEKRNLGVPLRTLYILLGFILLLWGALFITSELLMYNATQRFHSLHYSAAIPRFRWVARLNPLHPTVYSYLAQASVVTGDKEDLAYAERHLRQLHPLTAYAHQQLASLYFLEYSKTQDPKFLSRTLEEISTAVSINPMYISRYPIAASIAAQSGRYDEAAEYMYKDLSLNPTSVVGWTLLAKIEQLRGHKEQMQRALQKALSYAPADPQLQQLVTMVEQATDLQKVPLNIVMNGIPF